MQIERFIETRSAVWQRLEELLDRTEIAPDEVSHEEVQELVQLYRRACSDLNMASSYTANPELLGRLNQLTGRAYRYVYQAGHQKPILPAFRHLVVNEIPAAFRRERLAVALAAGVFILGMLLGALAVTVDRANGPRLIPGQFFTESPKQRVERIENDEERIDSMEKATTFGASLYTHNIQVAFATFSLGALTIAGGLLMIFYNGVILGAIMALYIFDGVSTFFFAWVGPHGALELPAIVFAGAAGIVIGRALLMPGNLTRQASVRRVLPNVWRIIIASCMILVFAGIVEGSFSQFTSSTFPYALKISVAALLFAALMIYLFARRLDEVSR